jgi:phage terminase large subunit
MKEVPSGWIKAKNEVELSLTLFNGSIIELKGAENPDALRGIKLRGLVIDEIASIRNWEWLWQEVLRPTLTDYGAPGLFISTPKGFNHFYELFQRGQGTEGKTDISYKSWRFTSYDNPYISKEEIDNAQKELTEDTFAQEYMADFRKFVGLVYKEFNRETHVKELPDFRPVFYIRGLDRGFRNPTAVPWIGVDKDGVWYQTEEIYEAGLTNPPLAEKLRKMRGNVDPEYSTMDSAQASDIADLASLGEDFVPVKKESGEQNKNYVEFKIQKFAERLKVKADGRAGYYVHPRCVNTLKEFESYRWKERNQSESQDLNLLNEPEKANDHMMDALGDLNCMYLHEYIAIMKKPWEGKVPGTYVPPADETPEESNWTSDKVDDWGDYG